jgi:SHS2 domain-containing protein
MMPAFGFRERAHTADLELEVWAPDLPGLLEQAARGMYSLSGLKLKDGPTQEYQVELNAQDAESLVVRFLTELLLIAESVRMGFDQFTITVEDKYYLQANLSGQFIESLSKEIKAVTYHNLEVIHTSQGLSVNIVFDV